MAKHGYVKMKPRSKPRKKYKDLVDQMIGAYRQIPSLSMGSPVFYADPVRYAENPAPKQRKPKK